MDTVLSPFSILSILFWSYFQASALGAKPANGVLDVIKVDNCPGARLPNKMFYLNITMPKRNVIVANAEFVIEKYVHNPKAVIEFLKCQDRDANMCETHLRIRENKICNFMNAQDKFWTPVFQSFHPRLPCPDMNRGTYKLVNATVNLNDLMKLADHLPRSDLYDFYWKLIFEFYYKREKVTCLFMIFKLY